MTKRRQPAFPRFSIRFGWLALLALTAQLVVIYVGFGDAGIIRRIVFPSSLILLLLFVLLNRRYLGFLIAGVGISLNLIVVLANGGLMPVSPANLERAGHGDQIAEVSLGDAVPASKNVLLEEDDTHLQLLSDRIAWRAMEPVSVFSIGDVVIAGSLLVIMAHILLAMLAGASRDQPSPT